MASVMALREKWSQAEQPTFEGKRELPTAENDGWLTPDYSQG